MRLPRSQTARWALYVGIGLLFLIALDIWWVVAYRHNYPFDVDEAGYTVIGLNDWIGLQVGGISGWWEAVQTQTPNAPLLPTVTSVLLLAHQGVLVGFGTLIGFSVILVFATYGIGERLAGPRLGALAAFAVATSYGAFAFTREYIFAMPAGAMMSCAVLALVRGDALRSRRWAAALGAAIGLMLLARTMTVAFVPGLAVAAVVLIAARGRDDLGNRLRNLLLASVVAFGVTITWYWRNFGPVKEYLTTYGYGAQAANYGTEHSPLSYVRFKGVLERIAELELLAPLTLLVSLGLIAMAIAAVVRVKNAEDRRAELLHLAGSNTLAVAIVFASGYAALMSSQNGGDGFTFPLAMLLPPLAVVALRVYRHLAVPITVVVVIFSTVTVVATSTFWDWASMQRNAYLPIVNELPWTKGQPNVVGAIRTQVPGNPYRFEGDDAGWTPIDHKLANLLFSPIGPDHTYPLTAFASRNRVLSINSVLLAGVLDHRAPVPAIQLTGEPADTVANYVHQLTAPEFGQPTALVTMSSEVEDFPPLVTQSKAEAAARKVGFHRIRQITLPDGRKLRVWVLSKAPTPASP